MTPEEWAHGHKSPPSFTACGHWNHTHPDLSSGVRLIAREGEGVCRDCGHRWTEHLLDISDDVYDYLLAYMAFRLDSKK